MGTHLSVLRALARLCDVPAAGRCDAAERLRRRMSAALVLSVTGVLALSACVARAEPPKLISYGNFASEGPGIAADQASGDVYTSGLVKFTNGAATAIGHINKFDASGNLISPPSPFAEGYHSGAAINPTNGDLYVVNALGSIETYDPSSGAQLSSFSIPPSSNVFGLFTIVQIASDAAGNVYVPNVPNNEVEEYNSSGALLQSFTGSGVGVLKEPRGVAVDPAGNLWVADTGNNRIEELSPTGAFIGEIKSEGVQAVAVGAHGDVYAIVENSADFCGSLASPCAHLVEYSSTGAQLADVGAGDFGLPQLTLPSMLAVNESSGRVYVTDGLKNLVWIFAPPVAPVIGRELVAEVGTSEAKLGALINPGGIETSYRFEYGATAAYGETTPFPDGNVGQGVSSRTVWAAASTLAPGTAYHYRVIATNELGTVVGPDQTFTTETNAQASCPNEQLRGGFSASLPDCRAYELVTPPTKASAEPDTVVFNPSVTGFGENEGNVSARDGDRMAYRALEVLPGSQSGGEDYLATRDGFGWSTEDVIPLESYTALECSREGIGAGALAYSTDLSKGIINVDLSSRASHQFGAHGDSGCSAEGVEVVSGEPIGYSNLLLRDNATGTYQLINVLPSGVTPADADFRGASSDLSHIVFSEGAPLTANAPMGAEDLYEWVNGVLRLVTVLPDGTPVEGGLAESGNLVTGGHAVSIDGSHVLFVAGGKLYMRVDGESTVQLDASQAGGSGGGGQFWDAGGDGSQVWFTDDASAGLTSDTVPGSGSNLYRYAAGRLTDLTPAGHVQVQGVVGGSEDGSYVYFVARGSLAGGAVEGQENLYLYHGGTTTFIATLGGFALLDLKEGGAQLSSSGALLAFTSNTSPTGYDNIDVQTGRPDPEIYLYDAGSNRLACVSCNPSGEAPVTGGAGLERHGTYTGTHSLSVGGRVFFETAEGLLPSDTNGQIDVYEYEEGQLHLISSGASSSSSKFLDASENGDDVFFFTRQQLVPQDTEAEARVIYDARVDGGFPALSSTPPCVTADACRAPVSPQPSIFGAPSSQTFSGAGNLTPASEVRPKKKIKAKKVCRRQKHKHARCIKRTSRARAKVKSHKGGK